MIEIPCEVRLKGPKGQLSAWLSNEKSVAILEARRWVVIETRGGEVATTPEPVLVEAEPIEPPTPKPARRKPAATRRRKA